MVVVVVVVGWWWWWGGGGGWGWKVETVELKASYTATGTATSAPDELWPTTANLRLEAEEGGVGSPSCFCRFSMYLCACMAGEGGFMWLLDPQQATLQAGNDVHVASRCTRMLV